VIHRGQVFWVTFDPTLGSEIQKTRPALVVSNDINNKHSPLVTVLPITSKTGDRVYPYEVLLGTGAAGLREGGKIKANQIRTLDKQRFKGRALGTLREDLMSSVDEAMKIHLGLS
jgi:mRNA interferase MazF